MSKTGCLNLKAAGAAIILLGGIFYHQNQQGLERLMDVKKKTSSIANRLLLDFPSGLDGELAFSKALTLSPQIAQLGRVDLNGSNPIPEFLPDGVYHFEKDSPIIRARRIVLWIEVSRLWLRRYVVLDSTWKVIVINSSESLPRF